MKTHRQRYLAKLSTQRRPVHDDVLAQHVCEEWLERLSWIKAPPQNLLLLGPTSEMGFRQIPTLWPNTQLQLADEATLATLAPDSFDGALLYLTGCFGSDTPDLFKAIQRILKPQAFWGFTLWGVGSFPEMYAAWHTIAPSKPIQPPFWDMHNLGDFLAQNGWQDPVLDREEITLAYTRLEALIREFKNLGGAYRPPLEPGETLITPAQWKKWQTAYPEHPEGYALTFELIHGITWKTLPASSEAFVSVNTISKNNPFSP